MSNLGSGGPPERVPSTPGNLDISREDIRRAERRELGGGTDTVVYATELDGRSSTRLAVKVADPDGTMDAAQFDRIVEEATTWEQLTADEESRSGEIERQDHIVDIVDWGTEPLPWLALEFMDGGSLRDALDEGDGQLPLDQALWVGARVCDGVLHAHRHGVVHRDLKPSNILFRKPARGWLFPKVGDWGLARVMLETDTRRGLTPAYAAPEQFHPNQYGQPGPETDIYQIGVLVYELVTGALPFEGPAPDISEAKTSEEPTPPSEVADVPPAVDDVLGPALEAEKSARYEDIVYLRDELDALFEHRHAEAPGAGSAVPSSSGATSARDHTNSSGGVGTAVERDSSGSAADADSEDPSQADEDAESLGKPPENDDRDGDSPAMGSWDEYREELERRQRRFLYSVLPGSLRRLFYNELVTEIDRAERRRDEVEADIEERKDTARELVRQIDQERLDVGGFSELSQETLERVGEVEDTRARLDTLLEKHRTYLTADEQETATRLRDQLADCEAYLHTKPRLDRRVRRVAEELDSIEERIDETLTESDLLAAEQKRELASHLDAVSQSLSTCRRRLDMDAVTTQDREQFDRLLKREGDLRDRIEQHNPDLVQQRYSDRIDAATAVRERTDAAIEAYQSDGTDCPEQPATYLEQLDEQLDALAAFLDSRQTEFLSPDQADRMERLHDDLAANRTLFEAKAEFEARFPELRDEVDAVAATVAETLDCETYLSAGERERLEGRLDEIRSRLDDVRANEAFQRLTETDRTRLTACHERLDDLEAEIEAYNPTLVEQRGDRHSEAATRVLAAIRETLAPCRADGEPLPEPADTYIARLDGAIQAFGEFLDQPQTTHLTADHRDRIETLRTDLRSERNYIEAKAELDSRLDEIRSEIAELETATDEQLDMETYLTTPERETLQEQVDTARDRMAAVDERLLETVSDADVERFERCRNELSSLATGIKTYNEQFVERECDTLDDLGPADDKPLNEKQRLAVVRDDLHNRVIAGPGTGKTSSLISRIKYFVDRGVPQSEILAIAFTNNNKHELEKRLRERFDVSGVDVSKFHSFCAREIRRADSTAIFLTDEESLREIGELLRELLEQRDDIRTHYEELREHLEQSLSYIFDEKEKFYKTRERKPGQTLAGETVRMSDRESKEALTTIADTLFRYEIDYRYRKYAPWADHSTGRAYIPDFTLPKQGIYVDYIPTEASNNRRQYYNQKRSAERLRRFYRGTDKTLVTIQGENARGAVADHVKYRLNESTVQLEQRLYRPDLIRRMYEYNKIDREIEEQLASFIEKSKRNAIDPSSRLDTLLKEEEPVVYHFSHIATAVLEEYKPRYDTYNAYDYDDMIAKTTEILERDDDSMAYQHVLVDEFQDLNRAQIELLRAILEHSDGAHLFAVGDDWQSIYGFRGGRPEFFVNFENQFAPSATTRLDINYRCPPSVVQASSALMTDIDSKTDKSLEAVSERDRTPTIHTVPGKEGYQYQTNAITRIAELVADSIEREGRSPDEVLVLARNGEGGPFVNRISAELRDNDIPTSGDNGVRVTTAHGAKGTEAEHVIVVNASAEDKDGFPTVERESELTQLVDAREYSHLDEERRLFYMALTRAEERLDIQTRANWESPFLEPLEEYVQREHVPIDCREDRVSVEATVESLMDDPPVKQVGKMNIDGYELRYRIPDDTENTALLKPGRTYRVEEIELGEHEGELQLVIDDTASVERLPDEMGKSEGEAVERQSGPTSEATSADAEPPFGDTEVLTSTDAEPVSLDTEPPKSTDAVQCPVEDCDYTEKPSSVAAHITGKRDEEHDWSTLPYASASEFKQTHQ